LVRPARAHSCGCKSRRELITANEVKRNCVRVTERGEEARSINREPMDKNRIEGAAWQGERARIREALVIKARWRKSGGCAMKECVLTRGDLALCLKGRRGDTEREVSRGHSSRRYGAKGRRSRRGSALVIDDGLSQMFAQAKLADLVNRVKPEKPRQRGTGFAEPASRDLGHRVGCNTSPVTSTTSTARCGPACQVVWEGRGRV